VNKSVRAAAPVSEVVPHNFGPPYRQLLGAAIPWRVTDPPGKRLARHRSAMAKGCRYHSDMVSGPSLVWSRNH